MDHVSVGVYDYSGNKLCDLYDSFIQADGQAYDIAYSEELNGWKELKFNLPFVIDSKRNFRWDYIKSEYLVRLEYGDEIEWFVLQKPKASKTGKSISNAVTCPHLGSLLKTKNLYLTFDDETGIGTIDVLINRALANTGWTLGECDTLYERDGTTEKIRSLNSDGKKGAYQLVIDICNLFKAYPVYHGNTKTIDIHALNNKGPMGEMHIGKNLSGMTVERSTENIITRLYVEGEYGDFGYVGIDDVNPTGLSYLMNFDYYRSIGLFAAAHQAAYDTYLAEMASVISAIKNKSQAILAAEDRLNTLWGQINYVIYTLNNGTITKTITGGTVTDEQKAIAEGDKLYVLKATGNYRVVTAGAGGSVSWESTDTMAAKFVTLPSGLIGSKQVAIESKQKLITTLTRDKNNQVDPLKQQSIQEQIDAQNAAIQELYSGYITYTLATGGYYTTNGSTVDITNVTADTGWKSCLVPCTKDTKFLVTGHSGSTQRLWCFVNAEDSDIAATSLSKANASATGANTEITAPDNTTHLVCNFNASYTAMLKQHILNGDGLYDEMREAIELAITLDGLKNDLAELQEDQLEIEAAFSDAMGDMLRDGYWSDNNYAPGQEEYLYQDAIDVMNQMAKPTVTYTFSLVGLSEAMGYTEKLPEINDKVKVWDTELKIVDIMYVDKRTRYLDRYDKDTVSVTNDDPALSGQSFESIMSRISELADMLQQKNTLYERAGAINANGSIYIDRLNGAIDVMKNKIMSTLSNWYTDDSGAMIFESASGDSAMMLSGGGWMIADGKTQDGDWNWRTAADGKGLVADRITTGYLSADRIEAGTITVSKLSADVGQSLDLSSNSTVDEVHSSHITLENNKIDIASGGVLNMLSGSDVNIKGGADVNIESTGNVNVQSGGKINVQSAGGLDIESGGVLDIETSGTLNAESGANVNIKSGGNLNIQSGGDLNVASGGNITIASGGKLNVSASDIQLTATKTLDDLQNQVDNISVGAVNLLPDSKADRIASRFLSIPVRDILEPYVGQSLCVSFEIQGSIARDFIVYPYQRRGITISDAYTFTMPTTEFKRYSFVTTVTDFGLAVEGTSIGEIGFYDQTGVQTFTVRKIMIELGNIPTDWTPAPSDPVEELDNTSVTIDTSGISMSGGTLNFSAGSAINFQSNGTFNVFATDDDSVIRFGGTEQNPNFSLGAGGTVKANKVIANELEIIGGGGALFFAMNGTLANQMIVSDTQPSGHGIVWIQPNGGSSGTVDYTLSASAGEDMSGTNPSRTLTGFARQGSALTGSTCAYGVQFKVYNYSGVCWLYRMTVQIQRADGTGNTITIFDRNYQALSEAVRVGVGDYFELNTLNNPVSGLENITDATGLKLIVTLLKSDNTSARFEVNQSFTIRCIGTGSQAVQSCNLFYIP